MIFEATSILNSWLDFNSPILKPLSGDDSDTFFDANTYQEMIEVLEGDIMIFNMEDLLLLSEEEFNGFKHNFMYFVLEQFGLPSIEHAPLYLQQQIIPYSNVNIIDHELAHLQALPSTYEGNKSFMVGFERNQDTNQHLSGTCLIDSSQLDLITQIEVILAPQIPSENDIIMCMFLLGSIETDDLSQYDSERIALLVQKLEMR